MLTFAIPQCRRHFHSRIDRHFQCRLSCLGGFTLIEVLVTIVLVSIAVVGVLGGIRSIQNASARARTADLLQRLVSEKIGDLRLYSDPATSGTSGDFSDRGHPEITWTATIQTASAADTDKVTVTATRGRSTQTISTLMFVRPSSGAALP